MTVNEMLYELLSDIQFVYAYDTKNGEAMFEIAFQRFGDECEKVLVEFLSNDP